MSKRDLNLNTYEIYFATEQPGTRHRQTMILQKRYFQAANERQAAALQGEMRRQIERELQEPIYVTGIVELNPNYVEPTVEPAYDEPEYADYDDSDGYLEDERAPRRGLARVLFGR